MKQRRGPRLYKQTNYKTKLFLSKMTSTVSTFNTSSDDHFLNQRQFFGEFPRKLTLRGSGTTVAQCMRR